MSVSSVQVLEKIEHFGGGETILRIPIVITWAQCNHGCPGWLHMEDPHEVQACDECNRFDREEPAAELTHDGAPIPGVVTDDAAAREAHSLECGCAWGAST